MYTPDGWVLVKISGTDPHYRIFGSWSGGYLDGDSWRMNSGIVDCYEKDGRLEFVGHSGSIYAVHPSTYGRLTAYNSSVVGQYCSNSAGTMEMLEEMPTNLATDFDWII